MDREAGSRADTCTRDGLPRAAGFDRVWARALWLMHHGRVYRWPRLPEPMVPLSCLGQAMEEALGLSRYACSFRLIGATRQGRLATTRYGRWTFVSRAAASCAWESWHEFVQRRAAESNAAFEAAIANFMRAGRVARWAGTGKQLARAVGYADAHPRVVARWLRAAVPGLLAAGIDFRYAPRSRDRIWVVTLRLRGSVLPRIFRGPDLGKATLCRFRGREVDWGECVDSFVQAEACRDAFSDCFGCGHGRRIRKQVAAASGGRRTRAGGPRNRKTL
ncbi:MAG: hypothetical protein FJ087_14470 [Deltaproteobacteria bacterium]|nr:hypothetical protein [Deltaproteobacteria bacterium]